MGSYEGRPPNTRALGWFRRFFDRVTKHLKQLHFQNFSWALCAQSKGAIFWYVVQREILSWLGVKLRGVNIKFDCLKWRWKNAGLKTITVHLDFLQGLREANLVSTPLNSTPSLLRISRWTTCQKMAPLDWAHRAREKFWKGCYLRCFVTWQKSSKSSWCTRIWGSPLVAPHLSDSEFCALQHIQNSELCCWRMKNEVLYQAMRQSYTECVLHIYMTIAKRNYWLESN